MSKKLMLLAAGVLSALAFAALPAIASAGEYTADCKTGATCAATITSSALVPIELENDAGEGIVCTSTTGSASLTSGTSTGSVQLLFHGCKDDIFGFNCNSAGQPTGTITTNSMVTHIINIEHGGTTPGILITGANVTFSCAGGLVTKTVTGNIIGHIENPNCNTFQKSHTFIFEKSGTGSQKYKQITTTGTAFDLTSGTHANDTTTSSQTGTGHITYTGNEAKITC